MKKLLIIVIAIAMMFAIMESGNAEASFRGLEWGVDAETIIEKEGTPKDESDNLLFYTGKLMGLDVAYGYHLDPEQGLHQGSYIIAEPHSSYDGYADDIMILWEGLKEKYGETKTDNPITWKNDLYDDGTDYGMMKGVAFGDAVIKMKWETENTNIMLASTGGEGDISIGLIYKDKEYEAPKPSTEGL